MSITSPSSNNQGILVASSHGISGFPTTNINQWDPYNNGISISSLSLQNEEVRGEMVLIEKVFDPVKVIPDKEVIKRELVEELVEKILKSNYVEFTKQEDFKTNLITYRARAFLTPDQQVRVLRKELL